MSQVHVAWMEGEPGAWSFRDTGATIDSCHCPRGSLERDHVSSLLKALPVCLPCLGTCETRSSVKGCSCLHRAASPAWTGAYCFEQDGQVWSAAPSDSPEGSS